MISELRNVQNAAARVIAGLNKYDHITPVLRELHWLPVENRIIFEINLLTFKGALSRVFSTVIFEQPKYIFVSQETCK